MTDETADEKMQIVRETFKAIKWARPEAGADYRRACEAFSVLSVDDVKVRARYLLEHGRAHNQINHWLQAIKDMTNTVPQGDVTELTDENRAEIFRMWPNLRCYAHEERTMQAAWRKLKGAPPLTKADLPRMAEQFPHIYGNGQSGIWPCPSGEFKPKVRVSLSDGSEVWIERDIHEERQRILEELQAQSREAIADGVAHARACQGIGAEPLPSDVAQWTDFTRGIVWAAMQKQGVFG